MVSLFCVRSAILFHLDILVSSLLKLYNDLDEECCECSTCLWTICAFSCFLLTRRHLAPIPQLQSRSISWPRNVGPVIVTPRLRGREREGWGIKKFYTIKMAIDNQVSWLIGYNIRQINHWGIIHSKVYLSGWQLEYLGGVVNCSQFCHLPGYDRATGAGGEMLQRREESLTSSPQFQY